MIQVSGEKCDKCGEDAMLYCARKDDDIMCLDCHREYNPPTMTLIKFNQGSYNKMWNLELGNYEDFEKVTDISLCDWTVKCRQDTLFRKEPRIRAIVYHLEYHGDIACGRCVDYPYFIDVDQTCLSQACQKFAKPKRPKHEIADPPERSRYLKWTKRNLS